MKEIEQLPSAAEKKKTTQLYLKFKPPCYFLIDPIPTVHEDSKMLIVVCGLKVGNSMSALDQSGADLDEESVGSQWWLHSCSIPLKRALQTRFALIHRSGKG
jgi:hypothetical protein